MYRCALPLALLVLGAEGHGYVKSPPSRSYACKLGVDTGCGAIQYEPQSVEGPDRYPQTGPADGHLASGGNDAWSELDAQSSTRWAKTAVSAGPQGFTWHFTANHVTYDWRYFITKDGWDQNAPLARASFESSPFCSAQGNMQQPPTEVTHDCTLPSKIGYHVVLAVWDVGDTSNSFYHAIDLTFGGSTPPVPPTPTTPTPVVTPPTTSAPVPVPPTPSTPTPTVTPPSSGCTTLIPVWGNCHNAKGCCETGNVCDVQSQWYAQCIPAGTTGIPANPATPPPATTTPTPPASPPSSGCSTTIPEWGSCLSAPTCCESGTSCYQQSQWYAQCSKSAWSGTKIG
eukprot:TRINITY_DN1670_c0_g1_i6.p1 TRINITY_DN1670_c0_g1~~TRINITY_DN1670_c0_g1_i6.p1  ORF type:complete len:342 (+),score=82.70 TRINITY_DN1670_c0_g1_i6:86-1111(+)